MKRYTAYIIAAAMIFMSLGSCGTDAAENSAEQGSISAEAPDAELPDPTVYSADEAVRIDLSGSTAPDGVKKTDGGFKITGAGIYAASGKLDGSLTIDASGEVVLILDGADISCPDGAVIKIKKDSDATLTLASDSTVSGGGENGGAAITSKSDIKINGDGRLTVTSGAKGIKSNGDIAISGGSLTINSSDDAIHSDANITITGGDLTLETGDDGIHANDSLSVAGGNISVNKCREGLESREIAISGGDISIISSDDGINAAGGKDSSGAGNIFGGRDMFSERVGSIKISGGNILINADGDGIDSNDTIEISGGVTVIDGPTSDRDAAFDFETSSTVTGGTLIAVGSSGMAEKITNISNQGYILYNTGQKLGAGSIIELRGADGGTLITHTAAKKFDSVLITSPDIRDGEYTVTADGSELTKLTVENGVYSNSKFGGFGNFGGGFGGFGDFGGGFGGERPDNFGEPPEGFNGELPEGFNKPPADFGGERPEGGRGGKRDKGNFTPPQPDGESAVSEQT